MRLNSFEYSGRCEKVVKKFCVDFEGLSPSGCQHDRLDEMGWRDAGRLDTQRLVDSLQACRQRFAPDVEAAHGLLQSAHGEGGRSRG